MKYPKLVGNIIDNSLRGKIKGKIFLVKSHIRARELAEEIALAIVERGGVAIIEWGFDGSTERKGGTVNLINRGTDAQFALTAKYLDRAYAGFDGFIYIVADDDIFNGGDKNPKRLRAFLSEISPVVQRRVYAVRPWALLYYPSAGRAVQAGMSLRQYSEFWKKVCALDYAKMDRAMEPLKKLMEKTDIVRIVGRGTDLTLSIKGQKAVKCSAQCNIPDGEVFTSPIKNSVNGTVRFNTDLDNNGVPYKNIRLVFKDGRVVSGHSEINDKKFRQLLDADGGSRFAGEFALGINPVITKCFRDILFDEKIGGSFHIALGCCHPDAPNGNKSQIHFDMIQIQTPAFGGGEIYFDDVLVRKNGKFVLKELKGLNQ